MLQTTSVVLCKESFQNFQLFHSCLGRRCSQHATGEEWHCPGCCPWSECGEHEPEHCSSVERQHELVENDREHLGDDHEISLATDRDWSTLIMMIIIWSAEATAFYLWKIGAFVKYAILQLSVLLATTSLTADLSRSTISCGRKFLSTTTPSLSYCSNTSWVTLLVAGGEWGDLGWGVET